MAPTLIEVWAPRCSSCAAMEADLEHVAMEFDGRVLLEQIDASDDPERARSLRAMATPTLIGMRGGVEVFRSTGRASRSELRQMFTSLEQDRVPRAPVRREQIILSIGAGVALLGAGLSTGPSIPLVVMGICIPSVVLLPHIWRSRANRS